MEATKSCSACGAVVPDAARRCKECFHDFREVKKRKMGIPTGPLAAVAFMAVTAAGVLSWVTSFPTDERILVDAQTRTVQWIRQYQDGRLETERLAFDAVGKVEYVAGGAGEFQIVAITSTGDRKIIESGSSGELAFRAESYARMMQKPLEIVGAPPGATVGTPAAAPPGH